MVDTGVDITPTIPPREAMLHSTDSTHHPLDNAVPDKANDVVGQPSETSEEQQQIKGQRENKQSFLASEFGLHQTSAVEFTPELRKRFEVILDTLANQLQAYEQDTGNKLSDQQHEFLQLYTTNKESLFNTSQGWILANVMVEEEMRLRLAMLEKDLTLEIQGMEPSKGEVELSLHTDQGLVNKYGLEVMKMLGVTLTAPVSLPIIGALRLLRSVKKHESIKLKLKDMQIDISALPQSVREYMNYIDPKGLNPKEVSQFLIEADHVRKDFYAALGVQLTDLEAGTPWERFRPNGAVPADIAKAQENLDTRWMRYRNMAYRQVVTAGKGPGGVPLDLTNSSHVGWVTYEVQRRTIETFSTPYLVEVTQSHDNRTKALSTLDAQVNALTSTESAQQTKQKRIAQLQEQIETIKGREATGNIPANQGALKELEGQLVKLQSEMSGSSGGKGVVVQTEEARKAYIDIKAGVVGLDKMIRAQTDRVRELDARIKTTEKKYDDEINKIKAEPAYKTDLLLYKSKLSKGIRLTHDILQDIVQLQEQVDNQLKSALAKLGPNSRRSDIETIQNHYAAALQAAAQPLQNELRIAQQEWRQLDDFFKKEETIDVLRKKRREEAEQIHGDIKGVETEMATTRNQRAQKIAERDKLHVEYTRSLNTERSFKAKIRHVEQQIHTKSEELKKLEDALAKVERMDADKLSTKQKNRAAIKAAGQSALIRYDEIISDVLLHPEKGFSLDDIASTRMINPGYGTSYEEGYLRILDTLFQWKDIKDQKKQLQIAMKLLPQMELAELLFDRFNLMQLGASAPARNDLNLVFAAMRHPNIRQHINQAALGRTFMGLLSHVKNKALLVQ